MIPLTGTVSVIHEVKAPIPSVFILYLRQNCKQNYQNNCNRSSLHNNPSPSVVTTLCVYMIFHEYCNFTNTYIPYIKKLF